MLNILGMIILIIILFIIILLITGIRISLEYNKKDSDIKGCLKILIFKKLKIYTYHFPSDDKKEEEDDNGKDFKKIIDLARPCFKDLKNYLKSVLDIIEIDKIENHFIIGFESYCDTGKYIGIIWAVLSVVNSMHAKLKLSAQPSFTGTTFDACGVNEFEIYPLKLLIPTIRLLKIKEIRTLIRGVLSE